MRQTRWIELPRSYGMSDTSLATVLAPSIVSALSGLGGVYLGGFLTGRRDAAKEDERLKREGSYLAILVVAHLDKFANGCWHVALDDGTSEGQPAGKDGVYHETTTTPPVFDPLSLQVDWKVLPVDLMYDILNLPHKADQLSNNLYGAHEFDQPPDYEEFFWARRHGYAALGLEVSALAKRLRLYAGLPTEDPTPGEWSRDEGLREQMERVETERAAYAARVAARQDALL
jgi:hypothetical protein